MAVAQVASGVATPGTGTSLTLTGVTCAAGNILAVTAFAVNTGNSPVAVSSVTDSAGGNTWNLPAGSQTGAFFSGQNQFSDIATAWCQVTNALSAGTVTINLSTTAGVTIQACWSTYSGLPGGAVTVAATSTSILAVTTSAASPSAAADASSLALAAVNVNGVASSVTASYALISGNFAAWRGTTAAGATSTTFTLSASDPVWATTITVISAAATPPPLVVPQAAVMQAANW